MCSHERLGSDEAARRCRFTWRNTRNRLGARQSNRLQSVVGDESGFVSVFDGKSLAGREGRPRLLAGGGRHLVGEVTAGTLLKSNTFLVWRGGRPKDFELKMDYRISVKGNSGVNYRSEIVQDLANPTNRFVMRGYQFDLDGQKEYPGNNFEEKGQVTDDWNSIHLIARGDHLIHILNEQLMTDVTDDDTPNRPTDG